MKTESVAFLCVPAPLVSDSGRVVRQEVERFLSRGCQLFLTISARSSRTSASSLEVLEAGRLHVRHQKGLPFLGRVESFASSGLFPLR